MRLVLQAREGYVEGHGEQRTRHENRHVGRCRSSLLLLWGFTQPGLKREDERYPVSESDKLGKPLTARLALTIRSCCVAILVNNVHS